MKLSEREKILLVVLAFMLLNVVGIQFLLTPMQKKHEELINERTQIEDELAQQQLPKLRGCDAHFTVVLSDVDEKQLRQLGILVSCEARYETKKLYHK